MPGTSRKDNQGFYTGPLNERGLSDWLELRRKWHEEYHKASATQRQVLTEERFLVRDFNPETSVYVVSNEESVEILRETFVSVGREQPPRGQFDWAEIYRSGGVHFQGIYLPRESISLMWGWEVTSVLWLERHDVEWRDMGLALNCPPLEGFVRPANGIDSP